MEVRCGGLWFTSNFDSGNLAQVEKASKDDEEDDSHKGGKNQTGIYIAVCGVEDCHLGEHHMYGRLSLRSYCMWEEKPSPGDIV